MTGLSVSNATSRPYVQSVHRTPGRQIVDAPLTTDQDEQRRRRRASQRNHLTGVWVLSAEVAALLADLGEAVAAVPKPLRVRVAVDEATAATHELVSAVVGLCAEFDAGGGGATTRKAIADLAPRPRLPAILDAAILDGSWLAVLVALARPFDAPLADVLGRALPPGDERLRGQQSCSERVEAEVRDLDRLCRYMHGRVVASGKRQKLPTVEEMNQQMRDDREAKRLADLRHRANMDDLMGRVATRHVSPRPDHLSPGWLRIHRRRAVKVWCAVAVAVAVTPRATL